MNTSEPPSSQKIVILPGDGIGVDVTIEAVKVLTTCKKRYGLSLEWTELDWNADHYLKTGESVPEGGMALLASHDAIYVGAYGDPRVPDMAHARDILLGMRFELDLYVNHRPVKLYHEKLTPLKNRGVKDIDFVVFRENTEGLYVGVGGFLKKNTPDEVAMQNCVYTRKGVERIIRHAFEYTKKKGRKTVTMVDKSNALRFVGDLWMRVFDEVKQEYPDIESNHFFVDAFVMQMVKNPAQFDVVVTSNMFGDIVTDLGAQLQGGLGLAPSGNIHPGKIGMFEPVHGSAPKYAGKDIADPMGAILSVGLMLEFLGHHEAANAIEQAVITAINENQTTKDLGGSLGTREVGDWICGQLEK